MRDSFHPEEAAELLCSSRHNAGKGRRLLADLDELARQSHATIKDGLELIRRKAELDQTKGTLPEE